MKSEQLENLTSPIHEMIFFCDIHLFEETLKLIRSSCEYIDVIY